MGTETNSTAISSSPNGSTSTRSSTEERALKLLGSGLSIDTVAKACGVSVSRVSQLMSNEAFASEVTALRCAALQKHTDRDNAYNDIEDRLLGQLKSNMSLIMRPMEILKALQVVNAAKRRGTEVQAEPVNVGTTVTLVMPQKVTQKFTVSITNQVTQAGEQKLETIQSSTLAERAKSLRLGLSMEKKDTDGELIRELGREVRALK